jgi:outer membrane protein assembly factor BamD (BamD/ComL family)
VKCLRHCIAGLCLALAPPAAVTAESVQALRYGTTLFHFYQADYFDALTELMIAQQTAVLGPHEDSAELLRGGMSLSYGMDLQAEEIFTTYLDRPREIADHDRAWFYLAKMAWQRGELDRCASAMGNVDKLTSPALAEELNYLRAQLNVRRGNYARARDYLGQLPADSDWLPYHYYNMGAHSAAAGDWSGASEYFQAFDHLHIRGEETKLLRDRAYTAAGFAHLSNGEYRAAGQDFVRVRLESPMAEQALLGYGWAASQEQDYRAALAPWKTLSQQAPLTPSVRESLLALPYAYEQLGHDGLALSNYRDAARVFAAELDETRKAIKAFSGGDLAELLELEPQRAGDGWLAGNDILPLSPQAPYLRRLIASHGFQDAVRELRDLHQLDKRLQQAAERIAVLWQVDADQQQVWAGLLRQERESQLRQRQLILREQIEQLRDRIAIAESGNLYREFTDSRQLALWTRVDHAAILLEQLPGKLESNRAREQQQKQQQKLDFLRGLLIWEDSEAFPARAWAARKQLRELQQLAGVTSRTLASLQGTIARREVSSFAPRLARLQQRLAEQLGQVEYALDISNNRVRHLAIAELQNQTRELTRSLGQSKLAVARLYDRGSLGARP